MDLSHNVLIPIYFVIFSGAQGEYAGLRAIMAYLHATGQKERTVSL